MGGVGVGQCQQKSTILYRGVSNTQKSAFELSLGLFSMKHPEKAVFSTLCIQKDKNHTQLNSAELLLK